jgi:hypothetical protein
MRYVTGLGCSIEKDAGLPLGFASQDDISATSNNFYMILQSLVTCTLGDLICSLIVV